MDVCVCECVWEGETQVVKRRNEHDDTGTPVIRELEMAAVAEVSKPFTNIIVLLGEDENGGEPNVGGVDDKMAMLLDLEERLDNGLRVRDEVSSPSVMIVDEAKPRIVVGAVDEDIS